ncbi:MAG TPA: hypothetical protein VHY37_07405 [Tepidisphaeraceae bacterium]|jgi:hypothetical protein|nr:hypothetical protein [Tepidisphaeraceae bacterium]
MPGAFERNVKACAILAPRFRAGLQAIENAERIHFAITESRRLNGSVNIDVALIAALPNEARWDYAIGYGAGRNEVVHWVEIHSATDGNVKVVLAKLAWLRAWLPTNAPALGAMRARYVWVSSGKIAISPNAPSRRILAQKGLLLSGRRYTIS